MYCDVTPESRDSSLIGNDSEKFSRGNEHARNNSRTTVSMQRLGKHTSITIKELLGNGVFCWGRPEAIWRGSQAVEKKN
jgi:hypothetical protein